MKNYMKVAALALGVLAMGLTSCQKDEPKGTFELTGGKPTIKFIRLQDATKADVIITEAGVGTGITIIGDNLTSIKEMYFNEHKAVLNTSYITKNALLVSVPKTLPAEPFADLIYMITRDGDTCTYPFHVIMPAPVVRSMKCEYVADGKEAVIYGDYFKDDEANPLTVTMTGIKNSCNIPCEVSSVSADGTTITFVVPAGAEEGNIEVTTKNGTGKSQFYFRDSRGVFLNYEGAGFDEPFGLVPQGWNSDHLFMPADENSVSGNYVQYPKNPGTALPADGGWTENFKVTYWCGNWSGAPLEITAGPGTPLRNLFPAGYFADPASLVFKFELRIPKDNAWKSGTMQVLFVNNELCANDSWQNNTYIHTGANGGQDLCRGMYRPWEATGSFDTNDEWITVTLPLSDFVYNMDGTKGAKGLNEASFDSFVLWPVSGGVNGAECTPVFQYDNFRIAPKLK